MVSSDHRWREALAVVRSLEPRLHHKPVHVLERAALERYAASRRNEARRNCVRELPPEQKADAEREVAAFEEFKKLSRLHPTKPDADIWAMVAQGIDGEKQWTA